MFFLRGYALRNEFIFVVHSPEIDLDSFKAGLNNEVIKIIITVH